MDNLPRFAFYASGIFLISAAFTLFSSELLVKVTDPTWVGTVWLIGYGLVYMNIVFVSSRRFMRRLNGASPAPIIFGVLVAIMPVVWIFIYNSPLDTQQRIIFAIVAALACGLGAHFGHKAGLKAQVVFKQKLEEYLKRTGQLPKDLQRPHDNLNKN